MNGCLLTTLSFLLIIMQKKCRLPCYQGTTVRKALLQNSDTDKMLSEHLVKRNFTILTIILASIWYTIHCIHFYSRNCINMQSALCKMSQHVWTDLSIFKIDMQTNHFTIIWWKSSCIQAYLTNIRRPWRSCDQEEFISICERICKKKKVQVEKRTQNTIKKQILITRFSQFVLFLASACWCKV